MFIDPLAEKYPYNSTYAFQENKIGMGRELEGLELGGAQFNNYAANFGKEVTGFFDNASTQVSAFVGVVVDIIPGVLSVDSTVEASANTNFTNYAMSSTYSNYGDSNLFKNFDVSFENKFVVEAKKTVSTGIADVTVSHTESKSTKTGKKESESKIIVGSGESGVFVSKTKDGKEKSKTKFGVQVEKSVPVAPGINIKAGARLTMEKKQ